MTRLDSPVPAIRRCSARPCIPRAFSSAAVRNISLSERYWARAASRTRAGMPLAASASRAENRPAA